MFRGHSVGAIILAAGKSSRMGDGVNKVYREVLGKPVLRYSLDCFVSSGVIDEFVIVVNDEERTTLETRVLSDFSPEVPVKLAQGGDRRQDSSLSGVTASDSDYLFIHDAARPNFGSDLVIETLGAALEYEAAFPGIKPVDTIRKVEGGFTGETVDREELVRVQTPQCFERELLLDSLRRAREAGQYFTDDAGVVMDFGGVKPRIVRGKGDNIKLTRKKDLSLIEVLFGE